MISRSTADGRSANRERDIKNLALEKVLGVGDLIESHQRGLQHPELGGHPGGGLPGGDGMSVVQDVGAQNLVAAAGQRDPELLADANLVGFGDVVGVGDLLEGDESVEHVACDGVHPVVRLDGVDGDAVGPADDASAVAGGGAEAAEGDADGGLGGDAGGGGGRGGEVVGAEEVGQGGGVEAGEELAVGGGVGGHVADGGLAGAALGGAGEVGRGGGAGQEEEEEEDGGRRGEVGRWGRQRHHCGFGGGRSETWR